MLAVDQLFEGPGGGRDGEFMEREFMADVLVRPGVRVERICSFGHASPEDFWYDQEEDEWVVLLRGSARLEVEADGVVETLELKAGNHLLIPAHCRHRVSWTEPETETWWLACFMPAQADECGRDSE